jgi:hypothetical protein
MTNHPITLPPTLIHKWARLFITHPDAEVFSTVVQWGADQELEACCEWLQVRINEGWNPCHLEDLRTARRPKQPSLKDNCVCYELSPAMKAYIAKHGGVPGPDDDVKWEIFCDTYNWLLGEGAEK